MEGVVQPSLKSSLDEEIVASDRLLILVGKSHPWFERSEILLTELSQTDWVIRESGSGTQQRFEEALKTWGIELSELNIVLVLNSGEMVKAIVENGGGATAISELMVKKELQLDTLHAIQVIDNREDFSTNLEMVRPFLKLKHRQRFQTRISKAFEQMLTL